MFFSSADEEAAEEGRQDGEAARAGTRGIVLNPKQFGGGGGGFFQPCLCLPLLFFGPRHEKYSGKCPCSHHNSNAILN